MGPHASRCHVCESDGLEPVAGYERLWRVTSDCKPWRPGGRLAVCRACGTAQKVIDAAWHSETAEVYGAYEIYHQSGGAEQAVFEGATGQALRRSDRILERLAAHVRLPEAGRLLDVGCGNGPFLRAFGRFAPGWRLAGSDLDARCREVVEAIPGVEALYPGSLDRVPGTFDLVSMIHVLEHIPSPRAILADVRGKLRPDGSFLAEVPNLSQNPFDLILADHASHFTPETLTRLLGSSGFGAVSVADDWVGKELTAVARPAGGRPATGRGPSADPVAPVAAAVRWLADVVDEARAVAARGRFGVFGTSIAGVWLASELRREVSFFVDEDPQRVGRTFLGCPVYDPAGVPDGAGVFVALPPAIADPIRRRVGRPGVSYHVPPPLGVCGSRIPDDR